MANTERTTRANLYHVVVPGRAVLVVVENIVERLRLYVLEDLARPHNIDRALVALRHKEIRNFEEKGREIVMIDETNLPESPRPSQGRFLEEGWPEREER